MHTWADGLPNAAVHMGDNMKMCGLNTPIKMCDYYFKMAVPQSRA